jgi:cytochrome c2
VRVGAVFVAAACALAACGHPGSSGPPVTETPPLHGDATRGRALVDRFECTRCHSVGGVEAPPKDKQCTGCHADIVAGSITATAAQKSRWQTKVAELGDVPSLTATDARFRRAWIEQFLQHPRDLRPGLQPTMPRLALSAQEAADLAAFLAPSDEPETRDAGSLFAGASVPRGRELIDSKGCGLCHTMSGVAPIHPSLLPTNVTVLNMARGARLAPDLRFARDRWRSPALVRWLVDPPAMKPDTPMPNLHLADDEARDIAAYLLQAPLAPVQHSPPPARLPVLTRKVTYDEVATRVFRKTCWHCHGEPDFERGDGGPGNSGGFGFAGRGLNLSDYRSTFAGFLDDTGRRTSVFAPTKDGTPYVVAALLARQREEAGEEPALRGMPLGLPALSAEDVQLVETWIAEGRPR